MKLKSLPILIITALTIGAGSLIAQPANNSCAGAIDIQSAFGNAFGVTTTLGPYDNTTATVDPTDPTNGFECFGEPDGFGTNPTIENTLWYTFVGDGGKYFIETGNGPGITNYIDDGDTQIAIYTGACGALVPFACNEDGPSATTVTYPAGLVINTSPGVTYFMFVDGFNYNGVLSTGEFLLFVTQQITITCADPSVTIGTASANKTFVCALDTVRFDITGVITPTVGLVSGLGWLISTADLANSSDPLNNPTVVAGYAVQNPAPTNSFRILINDGGLIGSQIPYGTYFWTPVIFGNATVAIAPGTFLTQLALDPSCTTTGNSIPVNVLAPGNPLCAVGIADINNGFGISNLYPVPVQNTLNFDVTTQTNGTVSISIVDVLGKNILNEMATLTPGSKTFSFDVDQLSAGVYTLTVVSDNKTSSVKFVKQ